MGDGGIQDDLVRAREDEARGRWMALVGPGAGVALGIGIMVVLVTFGFELFR